MSKNKVMLIIMDGVGMRDSDKNNAVKIANTPNLDSYFENKPYTSLACHGPAVGLPDSIMGNSEVGHLNIGAGRVVMQDLVRISHSLKTGEFKQIDEFKELVSSLKKSGKALHLMGLMSDAGVHSDVNHLKGILKILKEEGLTKVYIHPLMDGRDTPPNSGINYVKDLVEYMDELGIGKVATLIGRYYAMDRDNRWDRVELAYNCLVSGEGEKANDPVKAIQGMYDNKIMDEFVKPVVIDEDGLMQDGDSVLTFNFRADRMREIAAALNFDDFDGFERKLRVNLNYVTFTRYQENFPFPVLFKDVQLTNILGEVISANGLTQLRIAETEKYAHVTYFFNGGEEKVLEGEDRILVPSPKVATYDLQPEMSAPEVAEKLLEAIEKDLYDVVVLNFANGDMVGHTGILEAAVKALENIDGHIGRLVDLFTSKGGTVFITADHGNSEEMWDDGNGQPHTQHSLNKVPFIIVEPETKALNLKQDGALCDIAPTILKTLGIEKPLEMTGESIIQ